MMGKSWWLPAALGCILAGCSSGGTKEASAAPSGSAVPSPEATSTPSPSASPSGKPPSVIPKAPPKPDLQNLEKGYKPTPTVKAIDLAKQADAAMAQLRDGAASTLMQVDFPEGRGNYNGKVEIRDPEHIHLEYAVLSTLEEQKANSVGPVYSEQLLRNNGHVVQVSAKGRKDVPVGSELRPVSVVTAAWPTMFPILLLQGLIDRSTPITKYISAAAADPKNYALQTEERSIDAGGKTYKTVRIEVLRIGVAQKKLGSARVAISLEASHKVPVTVISAFRKPGDNRDRVLVWHANWHGPEKFDDSEFQPPK